MRLLRVLNPKPYTYQSPGRRHLQVKKRSKGAYTERRGGGGGVDVCVDVPGGAGPVVGDDMLVAGEFGVGFEDVEDLFTPAHTNLVNRMYEHSCHIDIIHLSI